MGLVQSFLNRMGYVKASDIEAPAHLLAHADSARFSIPDGSIYANQASLFQRLSWVHTAVSHPANYAAGADFAVKRRLGEDAEDINNHPFEQLLRRPNPLHSRYQMLEAVYAWQALTGNAYIWLNRRNSKTPPSEMWVLPAHRVEPVPDGKMYVSGYLFDPGGGKSSIPLDTWEIVHVKRFNPSNMFVGLSPIEAIAMTAEADLGQQTHNLKFFGKDGGKVPGLVAFSDPVPDPIWDDIKREFRRSAAQESIVMLRSAGKGGVEWKQMEMSRRDMEFLAGRQFNKEEIWADLAPGLASMLDPSANVASGRVGKATLMELAVWPFHQKVASEITNTVLPAYGENLYGEFEDVRLSDRDMELKEQEAAWQVMTVDEVRARYWQLESLPDGGDRLVKSMPSALPAGPPNLPDAGQNDQAESAQKALPVIEVKPTQRQAIKDELAQWERYAAKRVGQEARAFVPTHVPTAKALVIQHLLDGAETEAAVLAAFESVSLMTDDELDEAIKKKLTA